MSAVTFEIKGVNHSLYFGFDAYQTVAENSVDYANGKSSAPSELEVFATYVHGGMVNEAILNRMPKPTFKDAYLLSELIVMEGKGIQEEIWRVWTDSIANAEMQKMLGSIKKKVEVKSKKQTG